VTGNYFANQATLRYERCGSKYVTAWLKIYNFAAMQQLQIASWYGSPTVTRRRLLWSSSTSDGFLESSLEACKEPCPWMTSWSKQSLDGALPLADVSGRRLLNPLLGAPPVSPVHSLSQVSPVRLPMWFVELLRSLVCVWPHGCRRLFGVA
jgi:hypothetical protein